MMLDLTSTSWSNELLDAYGLLLDTLPGVVRCDEPVGETTRKLFGTPVRITGLCVDQHAAVFGHGCFEPNQAKATYGTGCFLLTNIGADASPRADGLLTVLGWKLADHAAYVMEGGVYSAGSIIEWLTRIGLLRGPAELDEVAGAVEGTEGVCLIPAFSGLAAPHWRSRAQACWSGMTHSTDRRHLVRAAVEGIAFRVREIHDAMIRAGVRVDRLKVDGGLTRSEVLMQFQADTLNLPIDVGENPQVTAIGVGMMAGLGAGLWTWPAGLPQVSRTGARYEPGADAVRRCASQYERWHRVCLEVARWSEPVGID
jgi:glycerol kinase